MPGPIVVTGGAGFIGSHLVRWLVAEGAEVHVLSRPGHKPWRLADIAEKFVTWPGDVTDPRGVRRCLEGARPRVVYHLAAATGVRHPANDLSDLAQSIDVNLVGTLNVLRAALLAKAPVEAVIRTGGLEEYGNGPVPSCESQREAPVSSYSASQVAAAHYCQMLQPRLPFAVVTLRLALVYGPGQSSAFFIPALIRSCLRGEDFAMTGGQQGRDLIYVEDVVGALRSAARAPGIAGQIINVATGVERRLLDVAELIIDLCAARSRLLVGEAPHRPAEVHHLCGSVDKACGVLGWRAVTPLRTGLERTVDWYRRHIQHAVEGRSFEL